MRATKGKANLAQVTGNPESETGSVNLWVIDKQDGIPVLFVFGYLLPYLRRYSEIAS